MILFDTETTGLLGPAAMPIEKQPSIIEFCAVHLDDKTLKETRFLDFLVHPGVPLTPEIMKITGITDDKLKGALPFVAHYDQIADFFLGETILVAHNCDFDSGMLANELRRIGKEFRFPWPKRRVCTVEATVHIKGRRMNLGDLYEHATGGKIQGAHRAINDVRAMAQIVRWMVKEKKLVL